MLSLWKQRPVRRPAVVSLRLENFEDRRCLSSLTGDMLADFPTDQRPDAVGDPFREATVGDPFVGDPFVGDPFKDGTVGDPFREVTASDYLRPGENGGADEKDYGLLLPAVNELRPGEKEGASDYLYDSGAVYVGDPKAP